MPLPADPWAHGSAGLRCTTCMWFVRKQQQVTSVVKDPALEYDDSPASSVGRCRRHAPTISGYPVVYDSDWCGDHKLDEGKI